ncbi:MAG: peptidylprolyl isomerase [Actinobacteria bacterium]|nr:peptidylprolyl isomerase [Actinomycetota bacterium]
MKNITSNKFFIPGFALVVTLIVVFILVVVRGGIPDDAVATVAGDPIPQSAYDSTAKVFASQQQTGKGEPVIPDPPDYTKCIANKKKSAAKKGSDAALKKQCENDFKSARDQIMPSLIQARWYQLEAKDRGINISDNEVKQRFTPLKQQTFPKEAEYKKFLESTGQTEADLLVLVRNQMYQEKIREQVSKADTPTAKEIEEQYKKNKDQYSQPASRDLLIVFNSSKSKIDQAKAALESGDSFTEVAKKYSQDSASKAQGGKFPGVTKGQFEKDLDKAVFSAKKGELIGPIKTQFGYYLVEVTKTTEAKQQSLQEASATIKQTLQSERQQKAFDDFQKEFTDKWKKKTKCQDLYMVELCGNAPEKKEGATGETGAAPAAGN